MHAVMVRCMFVVNWVANQGNGVNRSKVGSAKARLAAILQPAMKIKFYAFAGILILAGILPSGLFARPADEGRGTLAPAFVEVRFDNSAKFSHLKPGDKLQGKVVRNVFFGEQLAVPKDSRISLPVARLERRRRDKSAYRDVLPWPLQYFVPKYKQYPAFDFADVTLPGGSRLRLRVASVSAVKEVRASLETRNQVKSGRKAGAEKSNRTPRNKRASGPNYELVVDQKSPLTQESALRRASLPEIKTVGAGTEARLALLGSLSASKNRAGEPFKALLIEPLRLNSGVMLPEGTVFEGWIAKRTPARRLSRPGSLYLAFNHIILPAGTTLPISASVAGVGVDQGSHLQVGSEGGLKGGSPGKKRLLVQLGVGYGLSKVVDDSYQLIAEAVVSTATDASTAGTARLVGLGFSGVYWLTRRGRDVALPPYTTLTIRFDRTPSRAPSGALR